MCLSIKEPRCFFLKTDVNTCVHSGRRQDEAVSQLNALHSGFYALIYTVRKTISPVDSLLSILFTLDQPERNENVGCSGAHMLSLYPPSSTLKGRGGVRKHDDDEFNSTHYIQLAITYVAIFKGPTSLETSSSAEK